MAHNKPVDRMFRAGQISEQNWKRLKHQHGSGVAPTAARQMPSKMAGFDDRGGRRDQGGVRDRGAGVADEDHIENRRTQNMGTPARASGPPSRGGGAGAQVHPARRGEIDMPLRQQPKFPPGGKAAGKATGRSGGAPPRLRAQAGRIPPMGGYYGGGGQDTQ